MLSALFVFDRIDLQVMKDNFQTVRNGSMHNMPAVQIHWPSTLAKRGSSGFSGRPYISYRCQLLASTWASIQEHTCAQICARHKCTQRTVSSLTQESVSPDIFLISFASKDPAFFLLTHFLCCYSDAQTSPACVCNQSLQ